MITEIKINNFKSVQDLTLPLGRFNVLIGANGSGKSNILEAIAFGGAAFANKLDYESLASRGIRASGAQLMKSAFSNDNYSKPIQLSFKSKTNEIIFNIEEKNRWELQDQIWAIDRIEKIDKEIANTLFSNVDKYLLNTDLFNELNDSSKNVVNELLVELRKIINGNFETHDKALYLLKSNLFISVYKKIIYNGDIYNFIVYSPEISSLRKFEVESKVKPLGIKGEGLFSVIQMFYKNESYGPETINEIKKYLHTIDWFDDLEAVFEGVNGIQSIKVHDRNISDLTFNQTNVNEGFLFLLFYISLIISKETPAFFAIDNIEASLHPLLCEELIKILVELSKKHNKQVILTTHNPFVLDGLDLTDPEQKLFVVRRNGDGETIADAIDRPVKNVKLSEAWVRGYIGGNPEAIL